MCSCCPVLCNTEYSVKSGLGGWYEIDCLEFCIVDACWHEFLWADATNDVHSESGLNAARNLLTLSGPPRGELPPRLLTPSDPKPPRLPPALPGGVRHSPGLIVREWVRLGAFGNMLQERVVHRQDRRHEIEEFGWYWGCQTLVRIASIWRNRCDELRLCGLGGEH